MTRDTDVFGATIVALARAHSDVVVLSADLGDSCELTSFRETYPERYFSMGLTEQNICSWAAGLAREGFRPVVCTFGAFLYRRALDQIEMSIAASKLPVILVGFVPGITTSRGIAHQAVGDVAVMRAVPNMNVIDVADASEIEAVLEAAYALEGPVYIRMLRREVPRIFDTDRAFELGKAVELSEKPADGQCDVVVLSSSVCTETALETLPKLREQGWIMRHLHVSSMKPFDVATAIEVCAGARRGIVTIENHSTEGGLGSIVADTLAQAGVGVRLLKLGLADSYASSGSQDFLAKSHGLDGQALAAAIEKFLN